MQSNARPTATAQGFLFSGNPEQMECSYEIEIFQFLNSNIKRFDSFVNIGANTGYWPVSVRRFGFTGPIVAVEPDRYNFKILNRNISANNLSNVVVQRMAVGEFAGNIEIYGFGTGVSSIKGWAGGHSERKQVVPMQTLDTLLSNINGSKLILIDVEGAELGVIKGASSQLSDKNAEFLIELAPFDHQPSGVAINPNFEPAFKLMWDSGFKSAGWFPNYKPFGKKDLGALISKTIEPSIQMYHFYKD